MKKRLGILCTQFIGEYAQLPLKYNIYGMTYFFGEKNKRRFNNAPIITNNELEDAYNNPKTIYLVRTFYTGLAKKGVWIDCVKYDGIIAGGLHGGI